MNQSHNVSEKRLVVVLGVHRSGTSLLAAGIESLGAYLGKKILAKNEENQKGYFENQEIVDFNERLLAELGGRWDNPLFDGDSALAERKDTELDKWYLEADRIFKDNFSAKSFIAIKDPRLCQLIRFWKRIFEGNGYAQHNTYYAHIVRHPMEVAHSQQKRLQRHPEFHGLGKNPLEMIALWVSLTHQAMRSVDSDHNLLLSYAQILDDPKHQLDRLSKFIGVEAHGQGVEEYLQGFIERGMRHNVVETSDDGFLNANFPEAQELYRRQLALAEKTHFSPDDVAELLALSCDPGLRSNLLKPLIPLFSSLSSQRTLLSAKLDGLRDEYDKRRLEQVQLKSEYNRLNAEYEQLIVECGRQRETLEQQVASLGKQLQQVVSERDQVQNALGAELARIKSSRSWRATEFLRAINRYLRR